jgi:hypothetical protein
MRPVRFQTSSTRSHRLEHGGCFQVVRVSPDKEVLRNLVWTRKPIY